MALINITPVMTSNTAPAPYVISASSEFNTTFSPWKAFNGTNINSDDCWATLANSSLGWIKIDFGSITKVSALNLVVRNSATDGVTAIPKAFILYGSNDDINFEQIIQITDQISWTLIESRIYKLPTSVSFRYYKIQVTANNGSTLTTIGEIKFWQDDGVTTPITNTKSSMVYCLPKNSTVMMKNRANDPREGMLGFADDGSNYGTLWMVNKDGKAAIPKAALVNPELLFDGAIVQGSTVTMSGSYKDYNYLYIYMYLPNWGAQQDHIVISKPAITEKISVYSYYATSSPTSLNDAAVQKLLSMMFKTGNESTFTSYIYAYFKSENSLYVPILTLTSATSVYMRIYGIK